MENSITPTLLQTSSLLNTIVTLLRSPSIPLQTTEWTPQLRWHNRNWNGQPSRSSAGIGFYADYFVVHHFHHNQTSLELHCCHFLMLSRSSTERGWIGLPSFCPADSISCFSEYELVFTQLDSIDLDQSPTRAQLCEHTIFGPILFKPSLRHQQFEGSATCQADTRLRLVTDNLITQLVSSFHPLTPSFDNFEDNHTLLIIINHPLWLSTPNGLAQLGMYHPHEQEEVHETVLNQVLKPSEGYIQHLCANRYKSVDDDQSTQFMLFLAALLTICPFHEQTMNFVLTLPVLLIVPSAMTFFESDRSITDFLEIVDTFQKGQDWTVGKMLQRWNICLSCLRMEGVEDVIEQRRGNEHVE
ncbi:hypothetical protein BLNAU_4050 [Blattamonas nauphoetae]|uniref:Uncharacterized protein n=1 Tax=Blattamonas nauphoetae TaxID=2049346 RepID=A0ABQ9YB09_9EUKA|nr:hypothetical protein BLNAU_4050 [Blattamonas nauphoetae]